MMNTNCPNCGAAATGGVCAYCGTMLEDPNRALELAIGRKVSVSFVHDETLYEFDMVLEGVNLDAQSERTDFMSADGTCMTRYSTPTYEADLHGRLVMSKKHGGEGLCFKRHLAPEEITC